MEEVIKEGALRLLTSEASCDVILSCQGQRMMAHKIMLSIASPVLQDLLRQDASQTTVLIFPDISGNTMSLILDYIYTGSVVLISTILPDFLSVANLLKLQINQECLNKQPKNYAQHETYEERHFGEANSFKAGPIEQYTYTGNKQIEINHGTNLSVNINKHVNVNYNNNLVGGHILDGSAFAVPAGGPCKKPLRKMPELMPISVLKRRKELYNRVFPSPWCPRIAPVLADPRLDCLGAPPDHVADASTERLQENDSNNNFKAITPIYPQPYYPKPFLPSSHAPPFCFSSTIKENLPTAVIYDEPKPHYSMCPPPLPIPNLNPHPYPLQNPIPPKIIPPVLEPLSLLPKLDKHGAETKRDDKELGSLAPLQSNFIQENETQIKTEVVPAATESFNTPPTSVDSVKNEEVKHEEKGEKLKPFKCQDCGKCFSQLRNYKYHRSIHEGTNEFSARCQECGKLFNDRGYLSSHMKIHRDRKEYACPHCPKRFNQRVAYNMHLRIHTGVKPHECPTCGKSFSRKMLLKQHQRVHTGERPYSCPECGKSFADRSNMSLHARLHTGIKPYACTLCPKSFTKKHHLKTHMNFHTGLKPYSCQKCGLSFSQSSNMRTHYKKCILKTNNEKPPTT